MGSVGRKTLVSPPMGSWSRGDLQLQAGRCIAEACTRDRPARPLLESPGRTWAGV